MNRSLLSGDSLTDWELYVLRQKYMRDGHFRPSPANAASLFGFRRNSTQDLPPNSTGPQIPVDSIKQDSPPISIKDELPTSSNIINAPSNSTERDLPPNSHADQYSSPNNVKEEYYFEECMDQTSDSNKLVIDESTETKFETKNELESPLSSNPCNDDEALIVTTGENPQNLSQPRYNTPNSSFPVAMIPQSSSSPHENFSKVWSSPLVGRTDTVNSFFASSTPLHHGINSFPEYMEFEALDPDTISPRFPNTRFDDGKNHQE